MADGGRGGGAQIGGGRRKEEARVSDPIRSDPMRSISISDRTLFPLFTL